MRRSVVIGVDERVAREIKPSTNGVIREVLVLEGDSVTKDQVVARLVDDDAKLAFQSAEAKVHELQASLESAKADLTAAQLEWDNPIERQRAADVTKAQLAESKALLDQTASELASEEAALEHIKFDFEKGQGLHSSGVISEGELIKKRTAYNTHLAKIDAIRKRQISVRELVSKYEAEAVAASEHLRLRIEDEHKLNRSRAVVQQTEAALRNAQAVLAEAKLRMDRMEIRAHADGIIMSRLTEPGSKVVMTSDNPGSARILSIYDPKRLQVRVDVPLSEAGKIGVGQQTEVVLDVMPDRTFSGSVTRVLHEANIQKNTLEIKAAILDPDPQLRPEMLAKVRFLAKTDVSDKSEKQRIFVPDTALKGSGPNQSIWIATNFDGKFGKAAQKSIQAGNTKRDGWTEIASGLQPGELVIVRSGSELSDGRRVRVNVE